MCVCVCVCVHACVRDLWLCSFCSYSLYKSLHGYNAPKTIEVVFHVIIPKPFWEWDANSRVYLRLGREDLGGWSQNVGDFRQR